MGEGLGHHVALGAPLQRVISDGARRPQGRFHITLLENVLITAYLTVLAGIFALMRILAPTPLASRAPA